MDWRRNKRRGNSKSGKRNRSSLGLRRKCLFLRSHLSFTDTIFQTVRKETLSESMEVKGHSRNLTKSLLTCWSLHPRVSALFFFIDLTGHRGWHKSCRGWSTCCNCTFHRSRSHPSHSVTLMLSRGQSISSDISHLQVTIPPRPCLNL